MLSGALPDARLFTRFQRPHQRAHLVKALLVFCLGIRVRHDAAAGPCIKLVTHPQQGADGDVELGIAVGTDKADAAAIDGARRRLQLCNDFHRAFLGAPVMEPPGKLSRIRSSTEASAAIVALMVLTR